MAIAQVMAHHLPSLRRYARALTGSQSAGDAYVAATLEGILSHPDIAHERSPKVALFRSFTTIWNSLSLNGTPESLGLGTWSGDRRLAQLTPKPKQAFLLVSLEGFTEKDAAEILDLNLEDVRVLLEEAGRELAHYDTVWSDIDRELEQGPRHVLPQQQHDLVHPTSRRAHDR